MLIFLVATALVFAVLLLEGAIDPSAENILTYHNIL